MIKLSDGELLDLLPSQLKNDTDMVCLSHALKCAVEMLLKYERGTMTQNFIDSLPEQILDVLAVELRSPYYTQGMDIEVKRKIIKYTLVWHTKAGTPSAVSEMIAVVFGVGEAVEWFNFTEGEKTPGYFDIVTSARMTEDIVEYFMTVIERVKNERSHIRRILIEREMGMHEYTASGTISSPDIPVLNHEVLENKIQRKDTAASGVISSPDEAVTNNREERSRSPSGTEYHAAGVRSVPKTGITNNWEGSNSSTTSADYAGAMAKGQPHELIGNNTAPASRSLAGIPKAAVATVSSPRVAILNGNQSAGARAAGTPKQAVGAVSNPYIHITSKEE
jgi:P2-related tail formation protein